MNLAQQWSAEVRGSHRLWSIRVCSVDTQRSGQAAGCCDVRKPDTSTENASVISNALDSDLRSIAIASVNVVNERKGAEASPSGGPALRACAPPALVEVPESPPRRRSGTQKTVARRAQAAHRENHDECRSSLFSLVISAGAVMSRWAVCVLRVIISRGVHRRNPLLKCTRLSTFGCTCLSTFNIHFICLVWLCQSVSPLIVNLS